MRGDSLRDFYAKALALVGLGTLASVGALVDYWPGTVDVPRVAGPVSRVSAPALLPAVDLASAVNFEARPRVKAANIPALILVSTDTAQIVEPWTSLAPATFEAPTAFAPPAPLSDSYDALPVSEMDVPVSVFQPAALPGTNVALEERAMSYAPPPVVQAPAAASSDGITGVLRRTGSSLAAAGAKTGSTIVGAFRAVGGAFRKIL